MDEQIKMFIAGEEVVCNKEFTINEEMLSASSTILNNCYPKSWETTKDYVSNFYYPKDYSRFVLGKGNFANGNDEFGILEANGQSNISYNTNVEKVWNNVNILGNTYQEITQAVWGKNLLYIGSYSYSNNGITVTRINNSAISINGTATSNVSLTISLIYGKTLDSSIYVFKTIIETPGGINKSLSLELAGLTGLSMTMAAGMSAQTISSNALNNKQPTQLMIEILSGTAFNNTVIDFQLEVAPSTAFEPATYTPPTPNPSQPKNIISVGYQNLFEPVTTTAGTDIAMINGTISIEGDTFKLTRTGGADLYFGQVVGTGGTYTGYAGVLMDVSNVDAVYFYISNPLFTKNFITNYNENKVSLGYSTIGVSQNVYQIPSGVKYISFRFGYGGATLGETYETKVMIANVGRFVNYISYGKYGIEIKNTGKNILSPLPSYSGNYLTFTTDENGVTTINGTSTSSVSNFNYSVAGIVLQPGTYTFSSNLTGTVESNSSQLLLRDMNNENLAVINLWFQTEKTFTITEPKTLKFYYFYSNANKTYNNNTISVQLEKENQATTYEPYKSNTQLYTLDSPLRGIGNYKDKLYVSNGCLYVNRKIGSVVLDGTENTWSYNSTYKIAILSNYNWLLSPKTNISCMTEQLSSHFQGISDTWTTFRNATTTNGMFKMQATSYRICLRNIDLTSLQQWTTWLGTNKPIIEYVLETPYTEQAQLVNLPSSYENQNNVSIITGLDTDETIYYYWKNYDVLFAGIVKNSGDISLNPRYPHYCSLQILDYKTFLSESDTLDFVISEKTISEAIQMVVEAVSGYGFVVGNINISQAYDIIGAYSTLNKTAYDVLQYLADISGSKWRTRYVDSSTMAIDFYDPDLLPNASDIDYTKEYWENNNIVDLTFNYGTRDYRNKQIILSDEVYGSIDYTEALLSNGYSKNFITQNNIALINSISINGVAKDFVTNEEKELGVDADFYYTPGKNVIDSEISYTAGTQIIVNYVPLVKGRQIVYNDEEVLRISTQTNTIGVISRYENRNDILSNKELEQIGETYIEYKGKPEVILTLTTKDNDLFNIGEVAYFNAPIEDLAQNYMVKTKETQYIINGQQVNLFYVYQLTSSFNSEKAINYFDNQRNKATGNIQKGESITRNIDINNSAMIIWDNPTITEISISIDGDNTLNSVLNSPFIE